MQTSPPIVSAPAFASATPVPTDGALALLDTQQFQHFTLFETDEGWQASVSNSDVAAWHVCTEPTPEAAIRAVFDIPAPPPLVLAPPPY